MGKFSATLVWPRCNSLDAAARGAQVKRLRLGLTDAERRVQEDRRRFKNLICLGIALVLIGLEMINLTHFRNW